MKVYKDQIDDIIISFYRFIEKFMTDLDTFMKNKKEDQPDRFGHYRPKGNSDGSRRKNDGRRGQRADQKKYQALCQAPIDMVSS